MRTGSWVDAATGASVSQQDKLFSHRGWAVTQKEKGCGERKQCKKERERQALLSGAGLSESFGFFVAV